MNVSISVAILTISTIIAASIFAGAAMSEMYSFQNVMKEVGQSNKDVLSSSVKIIDQSKSSSFLSVWVKNTGQTSFRLDEQIASASYWDVFLKFPNGTLKRFTYNPTGSSECWNGQILNDMGTIGLWEKGETIEIKIFTASIPNGSYKVRLALPNGVGDETTFSIG